MKTILMIISAFFFLRSFGIHKVIRNSINAPFYTSNFLLSAIPLIGAILLAVPALTYLTGLNWGLVFIMNFLVALFVVPYITALIIESKILEKSYGYSVFVSFLIGLVTLIIGLCL